MASVYDAIVIGGGPGGSTVATALTRAGRSVMVLEREKFPRFHVGESLLPFSLPIFDRLGVHEKIRAAGYQTKQGAFFWNESNGTTRPVVFGEARDPNHPMAYQVKRADFDDLLLRHAASCGAQVREETTVEDVLFEGERAVGVRARGAGGGAPEEIRAKVVVDASGQGALLSRKLGIRRFDPKLKRAALFAHYAGIVWPAASRPGDILLPIDQGVWYWIIPFSDGICSVGGVFDPAEVRFTEGASPEARFEELLARSPRVLELLDGARRVSGAAHRARVPAASLHAHARPLRGLRARALHRRHGRARHGSESREGHPFHARIGRAPRCAPAPSAASSTSRCLRSARKTGAARRRRWRC